MVTASANIVPIGIVVKLFLELAPEVPLQDELLLAAVQLRLQLLDAALGIFKSVSLI